MAKTQYAQSPAGGGGSAATENCQRRLVLGISLNELRATEHDAPA